MSTKNKSQEITLREKAELQPNNGEPTRAGVHYSPVVDIWESESSITLLADLPGVNKDSLDIHVEDRELTITGMVDEPVDYPKAVYTEYGVGGFTRRFRLGDAIDQTKINAVLNDGVLTLVLPKAEHLRTRKIEIVTA